MIESQKRLRQKLAKKQTVERQQKRRAKQSAQAPGAVNLDISQYEPGTVGYARLALAQAIAKDPQRIQDELARCAADPAHFINAWCWTYDPREAPATMPFILFPRQEEYLTWLQERESLQEDGLVEKSRDAGATYVSCAYALHAWLFRPGISIAFGSRKLNLVDKIGDPDSIFEKLRLMLRPLPQWMLPDGFNWGAHDNFTKLLNPKNGNTITGEGGDEIGRGGRKSIYFVDEHAFLKHPNKAEAALSQNTRCIIRISTPNGQGNAFYVKRFSGEVSVFTFHWKQDPRKDEAWYEREKKRIGNPVTVAQEIDIDYSASIEGIAIPGKFVKAAVEFAEWLDKTRGLVLPIDGPCSAGYDIADGGENQNVMVFRRGPVIKKVESWGQLTTTQSARKAIRLAQEFDVAVLNYDTGGGFASALKGKLYDQELDEAAEAEREAGQEPEEPDSEAADAASDEPDGETETRFKFRANGVNGGAPASNKARWPDGKTSAQKFVNVRAELWYGILRTRFEKTYEYRELGIAHPLDELISIPNHAALIADLSLPLCFENEGGKAQLESKAQMRKRGVKSPDFGDALAYSFARRAKPKWESS